MPAACVACSEVLLLGIMRQETHNDLIRRALDHLDAGTTDTAPAITRNPVAAYISQDRLDREAALMRAQPMLIGLSGLLPAPGSYLADDHTGVPILLLRDGDGVLRAFLNSCRHRGSRLLEGAGTVRRNFVCPYHGWAYDQGGRLTGVPHDDYFDGVDRAACGLREMPCREADGLIWVVPDAARDADTLDPAAFLDGLADEFASYGFGGYHHYAGRVMRQPMNWKMIIDTFLEPYHFAVLHKATVAPIFFPNLCLLDGFGPHLREYLPRRTIVGERDKPAAEQDAVWHAAIVYVLFPNTVFVMQQDHAEIWRVFPEDNRPDRSVTCLDFYIPEPATTEKAVRHWEANIDLTVRTVEHEDFETGAGAHRAFMTGQVEEVIYGRNEPALAFFQRTIAEAVGERLDPSA